MTTIRLIVSGRVQGVGFRAFVRCLGEEMEVIGAVWNTRRRTVEVVAGHESGQILADFVDRVKGGPGHVVEVARFEEAIDLPKSGFEIWPTL